MAMIRFYLIAGFFAVCGLTVMIFRWGLRRHMKKLIVAVGLLAWSASAAVHPAASTSGSDVQAAINACAISGDTVTVPLGSSTWNQGDVSMGNYNTFFGGGWADGVSPKAVQQYVDTSGTPHGSGQLNGIIGTYMDHMLVCSNNANGTGKVFLYTNAVLVVATTANPTPAIFNAMSWLGPTYANSDVYDGLVEDYLLYTNVLTPANLLTIYQWHTNHLQ